MTKHYCDACGKELVGSDGRMGIEIPCHHFDNTTLGYVDSDMNSVSGRTVGKDLCNKCSNQIYSKAVEELQRIQKLGGIPHVY